MNIERVKLRKQWAEEDNPKEADEQTHMNDFAKAGTPEREEEQPKVTPPTSDEERRSLKYHHSLQYSNIISVKKVIGSRRDALEREKKKAEERARQRAEQRERELQEAKKAAERAKKVE